MLLLCIQIKKIQSFDLEVVQLEFPFVAIMMLLTVIVEAH
jgi:hypothetical protein